MIRLPAIDRLDKKAVRLFKGDYSKMTVYSDDPLSVARDFEACGCEYIHMVDLQGAKSGVPENFDLVEAVCRETNLKVEIGGGIRSMRDIERYLEAGAERVILGTAAVEDGDLLFAAVKKYGRAIAVSADIRDSNVAVKGWTERSDVTCREFFAMLSELGVCTVICTDISKDGAMSGTNRELYRSLSAEFSINIIASGGVSSIDDIRALRKMDMYGAIIGKAYYTKAICLRDALEAAR